jgi:hypothetical protein
MAYAPSPFGSFTTLDEVGRFLQAELARVSAGIGEAENGYQEVLNVAPTKPREGLVVYADGTNWNPGSGAGLYEYVGGAWRRLFAAAVPDASTTVKGIVELATDAETQTGTDTTRAVTPAGLASVTALDTRSGLVELATSAEVITGTDTIRAVTPAGLAAKVTSSTAQGIIELATDAEVLTGTDTVRAVTPAGLRAGFNAAGSAPVFACRAWVNFNGTGTVAIRASGNVSSITDNGVGAYVVNFTTAMQDANYAALPSGTLSTSSFGTYMAAYAPGSVQVQTINSGAATDDATVCIGIFR